MLMHYLDPAKVHAAHAAAVANSLKIADVVVPCPQPGCDGSVPVVQKDLDAGHGAYCTTCRKQAR